MCCSICIQASKGRTTIVVAHRLSTVRKADVIHCLSQGRLIESGSHDELMAREGLYYNLVTSHTEVQTCKQTVVFSVLENLCLT